MASASESEESDYEHEEVIEIQNIEHLNNENQPIPPTNNPNNLAIHIEEVDQNQEVDNVNNDENDEQNNNNDEHAVVINNEGENQVPGLNAQEIVRQVIDNLWPMLGQGNDDEDIDEDGMENVEDGYFEEENDRDESDETNSPGNENDESVPPPEFDHQLPTQHSYLGEGMEELQGRVVYLDEGATPEIPLIVMGIQLVPGQTLPLTIFHAVFQNAIRRCVANDRVFGIVHNDLDSLSTGSMVYKGAFGTLAEIYEFQEEHDTVPHGNPNPGMTTFALKAKGRQRFNVLNFRRQADGNLMGMVKIRPEIRLSPLVQAIAFEQTHRYRFPVKRRIENDDESLDEASANKLTKRLSLSSKSHFEQGDSSEIEDSELFKMKTHIAEQRKIRKFYSAFTPFPYFVYEQFEEDVLVEKVHRKLKVELKGLTESGSIIPKDATELSFWLAQNLTMDDHYRIKILKMDSPIQRLRFELDLLARACKVITCRYCQTTIAESSEIFSMSIEGPQGTYVNPHGFVHETLTVNKTKDVVIKGLSSTEASWFPGYSWTIAECRRCSSHLGWRFKAVGRLKPQKFWGLARRSISFKYDFGSEEDKEDILSQVGIARLPSAADFSLAV